MFDKEKEI